MTACIDSVPALSCVMDLREQFLKTQLNKCEPDSSEHAAFLTELAGLSLAQGRHEEANNMLQKAYQIRMKDFMLGTGALVAAADSDLQQHQGFSSCDAGASAAAAGAPAMAESAAPAGPNISLPQSAAAPAGTTDHEPRVFSCLEDCTHASQPSNQLPDCSAETDDGIWDKSDDWEPNLTVLRTASSFERSKELQQSSSDPAEAQPATEEPVSQPRRSASSSRNSTAPKPSDSASWRQPVARGRGETKCGAGSESESEWDTQLPVPNQPHIVEMYGLNRSVKTSHIEEFLLDFMWGDTMATVKWVDDEHVLVVFPCAEAAQALLDSTQSKHKVRPYHKASNAALQIAGEDLLPPRSSRPKTTTAVARRLISNALGNREVRDKAAEKQLAEMRKANKQGRQQRQQQLDATWGEDD